MVVSIHITLFYIIALILICISSFYKVKNNKKGFIFDYFIEFRADSIILIGKIVKIIR